MLAPSEKPFALVADDDDDWRELVASTLRDVGLQVEEARNGHELLALFQRLQGQIAVVVSDIDMPGGDGIAATVALRAETNVPVVLLTGHAERMHAQGLSAGAVAVLGKPLGRLALREGLRAYLSYVVA